MHRLILIALLTSASSTSAQERRFELPSFNAVETNASDDVRIEPGPAVSIVANGDPQALATLSLRVAGGKLIIGRTPGTHTDHGATIRITAPSLRSIRLQGSGTIEAVSQSGQRLEAVLDGSGKIILRGLDAGEARLELNGSGQIIADGKARRESIHLDGSGAVNARRLSTPELEISLGGSGDIDAQATRDAWIEADGSGRINISGHALCHFPHTGWINVTCG